jgi:hypothetical protein
MPEIPHNNPPSPPVGLEYSTLGPTPEQVRYGRDLALAATMFSILGLLVLAVILYVVFRISH